MIDHIGFAVADYSAAKAFYDTVLAALGGRCLFEVTAEQSGSANYAGFGRDRPTFWISDGAPLGAQLHVAFTAQNREQVDRFHAAALAAGATDNGKPGLRPVYHEHYYGAFVIDPDGHNVEAVCHDSA